MLPLPICFDVHMNLAWYLGLPAATWLMYLTDHVLDTVRNPEPISERHEFVRTYLKHILVLMLMLAIGCVYLVYTYYTVILFLTGFTILLFCSLYFLLTSIKNETFKYFYNKELMVACVYATALYLSIGLSQQTMGSWLLFYISLILITYLNLLLISIIELPEDKANHQFSWVVVIGKQRAEKLFYILSSATALLNLVLVVIHSEPQRYLALSYLVMALLHLLLFVKTNRSPETIAYRKVSETIFWIPLFIYFFI